MSKIGLGAIWGLLFTAQALLAQEPSWLDERYTNLESKPPWMLRFLRNEIYARHGKIFTSPDLKKAFSYNDWYKPDPNYNDSRLTKKERELVAKLAALNPPIKDPINPAALKGEKKLALAALRAFYDALNHKRYSEAVKMIVAGPEKNRLGEWNLPEEKDNLELGLKNGCEHGGLQCNLKVARIYSANAFESTVEFYVDFTENGKVYIACTDATAEESQPETRFPRTVKSVENQFLVMELPLYCP